MAFAIDTDIQPVVAALTANGDGTGIVSVASTIGFYTGQKVGINNDSGSSLALQVMEVISTTKMRLGKIDAPKGGNGVDLSSFTTASGSVVGAAQQSKGLPTGNPFTGPYIPDPVAALRVMSVDQSGAFISPNNVAVSVNNVSVTVLNVTSAINPSFTRVTANAILTASYIIAITTSKVASIFQLFNSLDQEVSVAYNGAEKWRLEIGEKGFVVDLNTNDLNIPSGVTIGLKYTGTLGVTGTVRITLI